MSDTNVVIVSAARTPIGNFLGGMSKLQSHQLGTVVIQEVMNRASVAPDDVSDVIMGQVLLAGQGQNPARQAAVAAGIPYSVPAMNISMVCGSGLRSVMLGAQEIQLAEANIVVSGGQESMSQAMHAVGLREGVKFGNKEMVDTMLKDGLTDAFHNYHMGQTAENVANQWKISREDQDQFSVNSQQKAKVALAEGHFKQEIVNVSVPGRRGQVSIVESDEFPKPDTTLEGLAKLRPSFANPGTVTAGNASGLNDGAAAVLLMSQDEAKRRNLEPLCKIVSSSTAGVDPSIMGTGPVPAVKKAVEKAGWTLDEVDLFELNEAFAAQSIAVIKELGISADKVNVCGGAIALGHPIGASGCRVLVTLIYALKRLGLKKGCVSLCIGGGMGVAMCVEC